MRVFRRSLFNNNKLIKYRENDSSFHHEYSIRPDTFAFKISNSSSTSPFQKTENFNLIDYVYRNSTNYPFDKMTPKEVFNTYPMINSKKLSRNGTRPRKVKMAVSDFIEDSLYNPKYGYFSMEVEIFNNDKPFDYNNIKDVDDFLDTWQKAYVKYDNEQIAPQRKELIAADSVNYGDPKSKFATNSLRLYNEEKKNTNPTTKNKRSLQLWHTPTELFQPFYGEAIARNILEKFKAGNEDELIIYEMGGGNGTLMTNILKFLKINEPKIYAKTHYKIIEISSQLALKQYNQALREKLVSQGLDVSKFQIVNKSIFEWKEVEEKPCFFIALEVFDNFSHDLIRYDNKTGEPYLGHVLVDDKGDFYEFFTPQLNYYSDVFLQLRENGPHSQLKTNYWQKFKSLIPFFNKDSIHPLDQSTSKLIWQNTLFPFKDNLSPGEFIPTRLTEFFHILKHKFPQHHLISSDFNALPNAIPGYYNGPVVQTVVKDKMVDITSYMCHQGFFDIMFPTNFQLMSTIYEQIVGKQVVVESHKQYLQTWGDIKATTTKRGENPMLEFYTNVSFMNTK
ncbi:putative protein arginine methyltransferase NDUFAF7 [[Candida] jaroonii]|uniref:Uncharacterized protein n=1 Tax=[Candida] jaroonii TaxID=467808 RepID=A0ACA9YFC4_9ASCO|nr:putative protein arginine methyltransferase NDUFAF7 [[Candida] jaroonii]